jgi:hypothetical protein
VSDRGAKGYLERNEMFIAMKLVAVAQAGNMVDASQLNIGYPPPKLVRSV